MSGYLEGLLAQKEPLSAFEIADLENWLDQIRLDCEAFGPCHEDLMRMKAIQEKISEAKGQAA